MAFQVSACSRTELDLKSYYAVSTSIGALLVIQTGLIDEIVTISSEQQLTTVWKARCK